MGIAEKILITLIKAPMTTGEIAKELGYIDVKGYGIYKNVQPMLNTLEIQHKFINKVDPDPNKKMRGSPPTTYDIVWEISVMRKILEKYPLVISDFQKNERVISVVVYEQTLFRKHPPNDLELNRAKTMLTLSHAFFSRYVENADFLDTFGVWWLEVNHNLMADSDINLDYKPENELNIKDQDQSNLIVSMNSSPISDILRNAFGHSIITDRMENMFNPKSLEYLETTRTPKIISVRPRSPDYKYHQQVFLKEFRKTIPRYPFRQQANKNIH